MKFILKIPILINSLERFLNKVGDKNKTGSRKETKLIKLNQ